MKKKQLRQFFWIIFGLGMLGVKTWASSHPEIIERYYSRGVFAGIRNIWDYTLGFSPVPWLYVLLMSLLFVLAYRIYKARKKQGGGKGKWISRAGSFLAFIGGVVGVFYLSWGLNYQRISVETQLGLQEIDPDSTQLAYLVLNSMVQAEKARYEIAGDDTTALTSKVLPKDMEAALRPKLEATLESHGFSPNGRVRVREIYPKGILMRLGATGIYIPFIAEGHLDGGLHPIKKPTTMTHEMAHGYGFGDEGTCNFWAYVTCSQAEEPVHRYAAHLMLWRYAMRDLYRLSPASFERMKRSVSPGVRQDLLAMRENSRRYASLFPQLNAIIYGSYLKGQGISEGLASYNRVVEMVLGYEMRATSMASSASQRSRFEQ
ncbi:MAG: DUF3810 domain-containing protein [Bacteroidota bacterium]